MKTKRLMPSVVSVQVQGNLETASGIELKEAIADLIQAGNRHLIIPIETFWPFDSAGVSVLIDAVQKLVKLEGSVCLVSSDPDVKRLFQITGLEKLFDIFESERDALRHLFQKSALDSVA